MKFCFFVLTYNHTTSCIPGLAGIMFDSPFLSDGSKPLRGAVLTYFSLIIVISSLLYFLVRLLGNKNVAKKRKDETTNHVVKAEKASNIK